jgi:GNAT superfamily N-acetyltransferase
MIFREASLNDIPQLHLIRNAVKENVLTNPQLVTQKDYEDFLTTKGKGWVCEINKRVTGFAIINLPGRNVWALFVLPAFEGKGIGRRLHDCMLTWYFTQTKKTIWLSTDGHTRAELFYRKNGWKQAGMHNEKEIRFEMDITGWENRNNLP